jgi:hypothetical protein
MKTKITISLDEEDAESLIFISELLDKNAEEILLFNSILHISSASKGDSGAMNIICFSLFYDNYPCARIVAERVHATFPELRLEVQADGDLYRLSSLNEGEQGEEFSDVIE